MEFHFAGAAHHSGKRVEDHGALEGHGGDGIFLKVLDLDIAGEAFLEPIGVMLVALEFLGAGIEIDTAEMEGFERLPRFLGKGLHHFHVAVLAHRVFEDAFWASIAFTNEVWDIHFIKWNLAIEALFEWAFKFYRMKEAGDFAHAGDAK